MSAPIILRQRSGPIITIIVWVFLAFLLGDALLRGAWDTVARFGPSLLLVGWLAYLLLWRPAIIVGDREVIVRELLRTTTVPFSRIRDIRLGTVVAIETRTSGGGPRTLRPWNAPGMPRRKIDSGLNGGVHPESLEHHPSFELLRRWERAESDSDEMDGRASGEQTVTQWNSGALGVTAVLVLLIVIGLL